MAGILGKIFGSGDVIKSGIDLIDSFHTSTEEEIAAKLTSWALMPRLNWRSVL